MSQTLHIRFAIPSQQLATLSSNPVPETPNMLAPRRVVTAVAASGSMLILVVLQLLGTTQFDPYRAVVSLLVTGGSGTLGLVANLGWIHLLASAGPDRREGE